MRKSDMMDDHLDRLMGMISPGQQTWDLSPNDVEAIRWVLADRDRLRRERNALLIDLVFRNAVDDAHAEGVLDTPSCVAFILGDAIRFSGGPVAEKYLDMPSDLGATPPPLPRRNITDPAD